VTGITNNIGINYNETPKSSEIKKIVKQRYKWDSRLMDGLIEVKVKNNTVSLSGSVASLKQKELVKDLAFVHGVKTIDTSNLTIKPSFERKISRDKCNADRTDQEI